MNEIINDIEQVVLHQFPALANNYKKQKKTGTNTTNKYKIAEVLLYSGPRVFKCECEEIASSKPFNCSLP